MKNIFLAIIFGLSLNCTFALAQQDSLTPVKVSDFDNSVPPPYCWDRSMQVEFVHQKTPPDEMIVIVAHLGNKETRPELNRRRLHNVRAYWTEYLSEGYRRKPETIGMVEGDTVDGFGRLEFYVKGKLVWVLKVRHDSDLGVGECYPPDDSYIRNGVYNSCWVKRQKIFYPCRDKYERRKNARS